MFETLCWGHWVLFLRLLFPFVFLVWRDLLWAAFVIISNAPSARAPTTTGMLKSVKTLTPLQQGRTQTPIPSNGALDGTFRCVIIHSGCRWAQGSYARHHFVWMRIHRIILESRVTPKGCNPPPCAHSIFPVPPRVFYIQGHGDFGWRKVMSFNFSVSESSERWYGASNSFPLMTRLGRARGKALVSSLGSSIWLASGNSLPRACSPARDCHCVDYCVWIATLLAVALPVNSMWHQNSWYAYSEQCTIDYTCIYMWTCSDPGLVVNGCGIDVFNSVEMSKAPVVNNNEVCVNCQRVLISGITDAQHVRWWLLEPTQRYTSTNPPLNIPGPLCALTGVSSPANIHQRAEEKLLVIRTEFRGFIVTEAKRTSTLRSFHRVHEVSVTRRCWFGLDWIRTSSCLAFFNRTGLDKRVHV